MQLTHLQISPGDTDNTYFSTKKRKPLNKFDDFEDAMIA